MKQIYFQRDKELIYFCDVFFRMYQEIHVKWKRNSHWGNELQFTEQKLDIQQLLSAFVDVFMSHRLHAMLQKIAETDFFYTDDAEINHICELTKWLMTDARTGSVFFYPQQTIDDYIYDLFKRHVREDRAIHFDALLRFCMKPLKSRLVDAVGAGIDEMKREEEHQAFIHDARKYVENKPSKQSILHIVQDDVFRFFKSSGKPYSIWELREQMKKEALYVLGLDEYEENIAPVLTLLPKQIFLYGDDLEEPKTIALLSIFQERVQLLPLAASPFSSELK